MYVREFVMWNIILAKLLEMLPIVVIGCVSFLVHCFVFHRLKCIKQLVNCLKVYLVKGDTGKDVSEIVKDRLSDSDLKTIAQYLAKEFMKYDRSDN